MGEREGGKGWGGEEEREEEERRERRLRSRNGLDF